MKPVLKAIFWISILFFLFVGSLYTFVGDSEEITTYIEYNSTTGFYSVKLDLRMEADITVYRCTDLEVCEEMQKRLFFPPK